MFKQLVLLALLVCLLTPMRAAAAPAQSIYFDDSGSSTLRLGNASYEIGFRKANGGLLYVNDKATGESITQGNLNGCLWVTVFAWDPADYFESCSYSPTGANRFSYSWAPASRQLTFTYTPDPAASKKVSAVVTVTASDGKWFDLQLTLDNGWGRPTQDVKFPADLTFRKDAIAEALLPVLPGIALEPGFFQRGIKYEARYPGWPGVFADYLAVSSSKGLWSMYALAEPERVVPTLFGFYFDYCADSASTCYTHNYQQRVPNGTRWTSPATRMRLAATAAEAIAGFRADRGVEQLPALRTRLGAGLYDALVSLPLYKADTTQLAIPFSSYASYLSAVPYPGLLHPVGYEPRGFDENYPDMLPPAAAWGGTPDMANMFAAMQARGYLVMPYINPTWWDDESPTLLHLPAPLAIASIAALDAQGQPYYECYGCPDYPHHGYVMSPYAPFVQQRLAQLMADITQQLPSDLVFEDQIGARATVYDHNASSPYPEAYTQGWVQHTRAYRAALLMTEDGFDALLATEVGFHGSVLLQERTGQTAGWWGTGTWHYYPFAPMVARDRVLFYQHDLAPESFTHNKATLSWNLALGYQLSYDLNASQYGGGLTNLWLGTVGAFQKYVIARYAGERLQNYAHLASQVTRSDFENFTVIANWQAAAAYATGSYQLPPAGALVVKNDGSLVAGIFTRYNGAALTAGEHYLIEERGAQTVTMRQPMGPDTDLTIRALPGWGATARIEAWAYTRDSRLVARVATTRLQDSITYHYQQQLAGQPVAYYVLLDPARSFMPLLLK